MWFISSNTSGKNTQNTVLLLELIMLQGGLWSKYSSHHWACTQNKQLNLTAHHGGSEAKPGHRKAGDQGESYSFSPWDLLATHNHFLCTRLVGITTPWQVKTKSTRGSFAWATAWLIDDRYHSQQHRPQRIRDKTTNPVKSLFLPGDFKYRQTT